jgi:hypothetical protein
MVEIVANLHAHTPYSDGEAYHAAIAEAAAQAGIDVVAVTDHNVRVRGAAGYYGRTLVLVGEEVHDCQRQPQASHCLVYGVDEEMSPRAGNPQALIRQVNQRGGLAFPAHPFERASPVHPDLDAIPWADWNARGFAGLEIWNTMAEFKARLWSLPAALWAVYCPSWVIYGPFREALQKWDELLTRGERVVAIGNADAHGTPFRLGPLRRVVLPYQFLFRCVNTHLLIEHPLMRDLEVDQALVYAALRAGRCFVGYDLAGSTRGFTFTARSGSDAFTMGDEFSRRGVTVFEVNCPAPATIRLLCDGQVVAEAVGTRLEHMTIQPGVYRVEARRAFRLANRGWIYSNPIYVR